MFVGYKNQNIRRRGPSLWQQDSNFSPFDNQALSVFPIYSYSNMKVEFYRLFPFLGCIPCLLNVTSQALPLLYFSKTCWNVPLYMAHRTLSIALPEGTCHQAPERFMRVCEMYLLADSMAPLPI